MSLRDKVARIAQEAALQAVNLSSSVIQSQIQQQAANNGIMRVEQVNQDAAGNTILTVSDNQGNLQTATYTGFDYPYQGQYLLINNGLAQ